MATTLMRTPHSFVEPARPHSVMARVGAHQDRHLRHKARKQAESADSKPSVEDKLSSVALRSAGVAAGGLIVGMAQGYFGTSKIGGRIPGELVVGVVLHGIAFTEMAKHFNARSTLRALGDGMFAAGTATGGFGLMAKHAEQQQKQQQQQQQTAPAAQAKGPAMRGYPEPESGGAALSDLELARFANRR